MASSTTKPTDSVRAISERLLRLYPSRYIAAKVPMMESGTAAPGIIVAVTFRRNRKITSTTSPMVISSVNVTSLMELRIGSDRSLITSSSMAGGISARNTGSMAMTFSTT